MEFGMRVHFMQTAFCFRFSFTSFLSKCGCHCIFIFQFHAVHMTRIFAVSFLFLFFFFARDNFFSLYLLWCPLKWLCHKNRCKLHLRSEKKKQANEEETIRLCQKTWVQNSMRCGVKKQIKRLKCKLNVT